MEHLPYILWILITGQQCSVRTYKMLRYFNTPKEAYETAIRGELDKSIFHTEDQEMFQKDKTLQKAYHLVEYCNKKNIEIITYYDKNYPEQLRWIACPPLALFVKGKLCITHDTPAITIVGTRHCTDKGAKLTAKLSYGLSRSGIYVISGLAKGIDTYAHKGCLLAKTSPTIAVLPCGVDNIYPKENEALSHLITQNGAIISELIPGTNIPGKWSFLLRNRILSALSQSTLVVESLKKGGSLITANHALEQNKTVFAVPGFPGIAACEGTNELIKAGATPCTGLQDIYDFYIPLFKDKIKRLEQKTTMPLKKLSPDQQRIYRELTSPQTAEEICDKTSIPFIELIPLLSEMKTLNLIEKNGQYYQIKQS